MSFKSIADCDRTGSHEEIRADVFNALMSVGSEISRAAVRGRRVGALLVIGDHHRVLIGSRQLVPNPFHGHPRQCRDVTNVVVQDSLIELSKLDGAFVIRADGYIEAAATFLSPGKLDIGLPSGLGSRHITAASVTARSNALAIAVSATDGRIRTFRGGSMQPLATLNCCSISGYKRSDMWSYEI